MATCVIIGSPRDAHHRARRRPPLVYTPRFAAEAKPMSEPVAAPSRRLDAVGTSGAAGRVDQHHLDAEVRAAAILA